jgi:hypothetical protein
MSINEVAPEQLAELFLHYHQALAPEFDGAGRLPSEAWGLLPTRKEPLNRRCAFGSTGTGGNGHRAGRRKALFRKAG